MHFNLGPGAVAVGLSLFITRPWVALFGSDFRIGAILPCIQSIATRSFDRRFAAQYAAFVVPIIASAELALTDSSATVAATLPKI